MFDRKAWYYTMWWDECQAANGKLKDGQYPEG